MKCYNIVILWNGLKEVQTIYYYANSMSEAIAHVESELETGIVLSCTVDSLEF